MALSSDSAYVQVNVKYKVEGLNQAAKGAKRAAGEFLNFGKILKQVGSSLIAFKAVDLVRQSIMKITTEMIRSNAQFEKFEIQLKVFTGSAVIAADLIDYLAFQSTKLAGGLEDLLGGATALATFGIDVKETLTLIADIATATGRSIEDVAIAFGRIVAGDPRTKQFLITRRGDIAVWNKQLAEGKSRLEAATAAFQRFSGVSEEMEGTFFRLQENLGDYLFLVAKFVGEPAFEQMKTWMKDITDMLKEEVFTKEAGIKKDNVFTGLRDDVESLVGVFRGLKHDLNSMNIAFKTFYENPLFKAYERLFEYIYGPMPRPAGAGPPKPGIPTPYLEWEFEQEFERRFGDLTLSYEKLAQWEGQLARRPGEEKLAGRGLFELERPKFKGLPRGYADIMQMTGMDPKKAIEQAQDMWDDIGSYRIAGIRKVDELMQSVEDDIKRERLQEIEDLKDKRLQAEQEVFQERYNMAKTLTDRAVNDLGFIFFGGRNANRAIDNRISKLREEVDVLDGITAPLTRQEQLLNSIVELESQRVSINQRIGNIISQVLDDVAKAAAKAAVLRGLGFGGQAQGGGGFMGLFKGFLGLGSLALSFIPGGQPFALAAGAMNVAVPGGGGGVAGVGGAFGGQGVAGAPLRKPIVVNQPIFLSNDVRGVAERFAEEATRRMR